MNENASFQQSIKTLDDTRTATFDGNLHMRAADGCV